MNSVFRSAVVIAFFFSCWGSASADSNMAAAVQSAVNADFAPQEFVVAERKDSAVDVLDVIRFKRRSLEIHEPGASFLKLHFSRFNIPKGVTIEVRSPDGSESYRYIRGGGDARTINRKGGDDGHSGFSAMSISGDTAIVEVLGNIGQVNSLKNRVYIDYYMAGYPEGQLKAAGNSTMVEKSTKIDGGPTTQSVCGIDQRVPAACWEQSDPEEFDRSWPVARLLINGSKSCTAWRVGPDNLLFTNNHCVASQEALETVEVWFNYQAISCNSSMLEETVKVAADTLFATHYEYDFTLFSVQNFPSVEPFGYLGLDVRDAQLGEQIYIPQHGYGYPKQIAIESDMNVSGLCEVDDLSVDRYAPDTDIGYYCDSVGGSSGSPVLASSSGRAVALHHFGGCVNSGVKMSLIWPEVSSFFGGQVPAGDNEPGGEENLHPEAQFSAACDATSCSFDASSSSDDDGTIAGYTWAFGDGAMGAGQVVTHGYVEAGSYNVTLTVVDDQGASDSLLQTVTVEPANQSPVAAFQVSCDGLVCTLDASVSSDADGSVTSYGWTFGDGTSGTFGVSTASHTYAAAGQYTVQLQVTDDDGATATADTVLTVSEPVVENQLPQATFTFTCQDLACEFDAGASTDADGTISQYAWSFGDGSSGTFGVSTASHSYPAAGQYTVQLQVTDDDGATATADAVLTVSEPVVENQLPQATFTFTCQDLDCGFDAGGSADPDGTIISYHWDFGDGLTGNGDHVSHAFGADGEYAVRLTVSDDQEASNSATQIVQVAVTVAPAISLSALAGKHRNSKWVDLEWSGVAGSVVDIYRNGKIFATTANDGSYRDTTVKNKEKEIIYRVCEQNTATCSDEVLLLREF